MSSAVGSRPLPASPSPGRQHPPDENKDSISSSTSLSLLLHLILSSSETSSIPAMPACSEASTSATHPLTSPAPPAASSPATPHPSQVPQPKSDRSESDREDHERQSMSRRAPPGGGLRQSVPESKRSELTRFNPLDRPQTRSLDSLSHCSTSSKTSQRTFSRQTISSHTRANLCRQCLRPLVLVSRAAWPSSPSVLARLRSPVGPLSGKQDDSPIDHSLRLVLTSIPLALSQETHPAHPRPLLSSPRRTSPEVRA